MCFLRVYVADTRGRSDEDEDSDEEDEDESAELLRELEKIRRERAEEQTRKVCQPLGRRAYLTGYP